MKRSNELAGGFDGKVEGGKEKEEGESGGRLGNLAILTGGRREERGIEGSHIERRDAFSFYHEFSSFVSLLRAATRDNNPESAILGTAGGVRRLYIYLSI